MCGILFSNKRNISSKKFIDALNLIKHRGPDQPLCYYRYNEHQLGHNRLSILDIDERSNQPFFSQDKRYVIIYNGEIYNYKELAEKFSIKTRTNSDTEVLLELYIRFGDRMLTWLNGMFSFVIVDLRENKFFVARDRLGVKPLYYYCCGDNYIFSSEISPIIKLINNVTVDQVAVRQYKKLRNFFNGRTIYNEIKLFPSGHYMYNNQIQKYWELEMDDQEPPSDDELRYLIESSVKYRMVSDVSVGSYLSGGLDSTIVTGLSGVQDSWTVGFENFNEFQWSTIAANKFKTCHHKIIVDREEFLLLTKEMVKRTSEPISVPNEVLIYKMTNSVCDNNTVILSGEGADELFFGYDRIFRWAQSVSSWNIKEFSGLYSYGTNEDIEIVEDALAPFLKYKTPLKIVAAFFQIAHLHGLLKRLDRATMLCSVEARGPFLDYRLIERLSGVSYEYKTKGGIVKAPLKRVFKNIIPKEIIEREKVGFPVCLDEILPSNIEGNTFTDKWFNFNLMILMEEI